MANMTVYEALARCQRNEEWPWESHPNELQDTIVKFMDDALAAAGEDRTSPLESQLERVCGESWFSDVAVFVCKAFLRSARPIGSFGDLHSLLRDEGVCRAIMGPVGPDLAWPEIFRAGGME